MSSKLSIESYNVYLLHACREGYELGSKQVPVVVSLLESGADVNTRDELGNTPLHWVCHSLRNKNSTGNDTQGDHSIHAGSLIILLLRNGANQFACNNSGWMPLHFAANVGNSVAVELLLFETAMTMSNRRISIQPIEHFIADACATIGEATRAILYMVDIVRQRLFTTHFESKTKKLHTFAIAMHEGIEGMIYKKISENDLKDLTEDPEWISTGQGHFVYKSDDVSENSYFSPYSDNQMDFRTKNLLGVPIYSTEQIKKDLNRKGLNDSKKIIGIMMLVNKKPRTDPAGNIIDLDPSKVRFDESNCKSIYEAINGSGAFNVAIEMMSEIDTPIHYVKGQLFEELKNWTHSVYQFKQSDSSFVGKPLQEFGFISDGMYSKQRSLLSHLSLGGLQTKEEEEKISFIEKSSYAGINAKVENLHTPLIRAAMSGQKRMVLQLLNGGADPYVQDANGNTALHVASSLGFHKIVEILIDAVCDPFKLNLAGFSPRHLCDAHLSVELEKIENENESLELSAFPKYKSLREITQSKVDRIVVLEDIALCPDDNNDGFSACFSNSVYDFLACNQFLLTHRLLVAAEAVWLRTLNQGHVNTWYDGEFAFTHGIYYPIAQDVKYCPLRGKTKQAHPSLEIPVPCHAQEITHVLRRVETTEDHSTFICKIRFIMDAKDFENLTRVLVYPNPYADIAQVQSRDRDNSMNSFASFKVSATNAANFLPDNRVEVRLIFVLMVYYKRSTPSPVIFEEEVTFQVVLENMDGQSRLSAVSQMDPISSIQNTTSFFNALLVVHSSSDQFHVDFEKPLLTKMKNNDIVANEDTYNILINAYSKRGHLERAEEYYDMLVKAYLTPTIFTYNSLLHLCEIRHDKAKCKVYRAERESRCGIKSYVDYEESASLKPYKITLNGFYGSRNILHRKRYVRSQSEHTLRRDAKYISMWQQKGFLPSAKSEARLISRQIELSSRQMLTGTAYDAVNHGTIYSMKEDTYDNIQNFEHGFCGSHICRFNIKSSDTVETLESEGISLLKPLQIPRGLTVITFQFDLGTNAIVPLFKNRSENKCIKIFPNFAVKRNIYPASMITQIPILSENVIMAKKSSVFGNTILSIFVDKSVFSLSGVIYTIEIPNECLYIGTPGAVKGKPLKPLKTIKRQVIVNRGQALWDRVSECPLELRRLVLNQLQTSKLKQLQSTYRLGNIDKYVTNWPIWAPQFPSLAYPVKSRHEIPKVGFSTILYPISITFPFIDEGNTASAPTFSCVDIAFLLTPAIVSGIYTNLKAELNIKLAKDDIDIAKISPDKAKRNTVHIAIYVNVPQVLFNRAVNELNSEQFRKQLLQGTDASYKESAQKYEDESIRGRKKYIDIGKKVDKDQPKQRERKRTVTVKIKITRKSQVGNVNAFADDRKPDGSVKLSEENPATILFNIFSSGDTIRIPSTTLNSAVNPSATIKTLVADSVQEGFPTSVAMHLAELLLKNQNEIVEGKLAVETYAPRDILMSFDPANLMKSDKIWRSKANLEMDKAKKDLECSTCNHVQTQNYFQSDRMNGIKYFHCAEKCHVCGHLSLSGRERKEVLRHIRRRREFPLPQMKFLKQTSKAARFYGMTSGDMILYRQYPKLILSQQEENKMFKDNEDDKTSIKDSATFDSFNFQYSSASWNMSDPESGWEFSWPERILSKALCCFHGSYDGPYLMSEARKLKIQNFLAGILDDDDGQKANLNSISKESNASETTISKRKLKVKVVTGTKKQEESMESDQGSEDKSVHSEHEISQQDPHSNNEDLYRLNFEKYANKIEKQVEEQATAGGLSSFFSCFTSREVTKETKKKPALLGEKLIENIEIHMEEQNNCYSNEVMDDSDDDEPKLGTLVCEPQISNATDTVLHSILDGDGIEESKISNDWSEKK